MQRICGAKVLWEVIAFTGRFDPALLSKTVKAEQTQHAGHGQTKKDRRRLRAEKIHAKTRLREAERLAMLPRPPDSEYQRDLLKRFQCGELHLDLNTAVLAYGHGTLKSPDGQVLPIGGSTVGESRRLLQDWVQPDVGEFLRNCGS